MTAESDSEDHLPDVPRDVDEISRRALILSAVIACAYGAEKQPTIDWFMNQKLWVDVSPDEREFLSGKSTPQGVINLTWRIEALVPLLWVLRKIENMPTLAKQFDTTDAVKTLVFPPAEVTPFISTSRLRDESEIRAEYEKVYDAHWRLRDAQLFGKPLPPEVNPGVVRERHHAFNWIIGYGNRTWDDISTDT